MPARTVLLLLALLVAPLAAAQSTVTLMPLPAPDAAERDAVRAAVLDYVEALYDVDPARIERSVHPSLAKVGYWMGDDADAYQEARMTYDQLVDLAGRWNQSGRVDAASAPKEVVVLDLLDQTATAKLTAQWGIDYMHLAKIDGRWMIMNVLWQSHPRK